MRVSSDEGGWGFERVVWMADVWGWWDGGQVGMAIDLQKNGRGKQGTDALSVCAQSFARMRNK